MEENKKKYVSWYVFVWVIGIIFIILGLIFSQIAIADGKIEKHLSESQDIKAQLSQIQTDLSWIKLNLK